MAKRQAEYRHHTFKRLRVIALAALYFGCAAWTGVRADDSQIYVNKIPSAQTPNVLFTIDTSGSMDSTVSGTNQTRIEAVKDALTGLINEVPNLKAGLERFHYELGAPIVFPVIDLNSSPEYLNDSITITSVDRSSDDAEEDAGTVTLDSTDLQLTEISRGGSTTVLEATAVPLSSSDDDEDGNSSGAVQISSPDLDMGQVDAGIRFPNVVVPKNATILHAEIEFVAAQANNENTDLVIHGDDVDNSPTFTETGPASVASRFSSSTSATVDWSNVRAVSDGDTITSPNIRSIIAEITSRSGWASGNALTVLFDSQGGHRALRTLDGGTAPILRVEYIEDGTSIQRRITNRDRDATELPGNNLQRRYSGIYLMKDDGYGITASQTGLIFDNVDIPDGAEVVWADIGFTTRVEHTFENSDSADVHIHGILNPTLDTFTNGNKISDQSLTSTSVEWLSGLKQGDEEMFAPGDGETLLTPNLASLIEDIRANTSFQSGDNLGFVFEDGASSGVNERHMCSFDGVLNSSLCDEVTESLPTLRLVYAFPTGGTTVHQQVGLRFNNVTVPQHATIESAYLEFTVDSATTEPGNLTIEVENNTGPVTYSNNSGEKISDRTYGNSTTWTTDVWDTIGEVKQSPDISSLVSSITDQADWCGGGSLAFRITSTDARLIAQAFDKGESGAPTLRIKYNTDNLSAGEGCTVRQTSVSITDSDNDVEESLINGNGQQRFGRVDFNSNDLDLYDEQLVGLRFENVKVPAGANILSTNLYLTGDDFDTGSNTVTIKAQQHPNAPAFSDSFQNVSSRDTGGLSATWNITDDWVEDGIYSTQDDGVDLTPLISNIIDGTVTVGGEQWASGNALVFTLASNATSDSGDRQAEVCCGTDQPSRLEIFYQINLGDEPNAGKVTGRQAMLSIVDELVASGFTPPVDALFEGASYFSSADVHFGRTRGAGESYEASGPTTDGDLDSDLLDFLGNPPTDQQLLVQGERSRLSHFATYDPQTAPIVRQGACTPEDPNNVDCRTEHIDNAADATYVSPFESAAECEKGFLVLLSDGIANRNSSRELIKTLTGRTDCPMRIPQIDSNGDPIISNGSFSLRDPSSDELCGLEVADYLQKTDFIDEPNNAADVLNNVRTFTVGFNLNIADSSENQRAVEFLKALAFVGNGGNLDDPDGVDGVRYGDGFYTANTADELQSVFETIVNEIIKETTSFVAPGISINAFNRLFNEPDIYFSLFRPDDTVAWLGNLKKFTLCDNSATCTQGETLDKNGQPAVYTDENNLETYGTLKPEAQGFWSDPSDSGPEIDQGGAGEKIPHYTERNVYVGTSSSAPAAPDYSDSAIAGTQPHSLDLDNDADTNPDTSDDPAEFTGLKEALRDAGNCNSGSFAEQNACLNDLIYWMAGKRFPGDLPRDGTDEDDDRWAFGDPMHSRPLVLTYGKDNAADPPEPLAKIFVGTNDGGVRMINEGTGNEEWIYYPNSMLYMQSELKENPNDTHRYGVDDTPTARIKNVDGDGVIEPTDGDFVHIYFGLRRGGKKLYALNVTPDSVVNAVTDPDTGEVYGEEGKVTPELLWQIDKSDPDFTRLGQTWSTARPVKVVGASGPKTVLIFGGGYDTRQDDPSVYNTSSNGDDEGNAIFMVDADTGERLWWASSSQDGNGNDADANVAAMNTAIAGPVTTLDTNKDGFADRIYAVDLRGQVFRVDIAAAAPTSGESEFAPSSVAVLARLGSESDAQDHRKFFYAPEVARVNDEAVVEAPYELISIISGNRADPQGKTVLDRAYTVRDFLTDNPSGGLTSSNFPACNPNLAVSCTPGTVITNASLTDVTDQDAFVIRVKTGGQVTSLTNATGTELTSSDTALTNLKQSYGWFLDLEGENFDSQDANPALTGEKGFSTATILGGNMAFTSFLPPDATADASNACSVPEVLGTSRLYQLDVFTGAPAFDRNADNTFDKAERFKNLGAGPSADITPTYLPGGVTLTVPTGAGAVAEDPGPLDTVNKTFWLEEQ